MKLQRDGDVIRSSFWNIRRTRFTIFNSIPILVYDSLPWFDVYEDAIKME
jgi:hypothetical protein